MFESDGTGQEKEKSKIDAMEQMMEVIAKILTGKPQKEVILVMTIHSLMEAATKFSEYGSPKNNHPDITEGKLDEIIEYLGMVQGGLEQYLKDNPIPKSEDTEK